MDAKALYNLSPYDRERRAKLDIIGDQWLMRSREHRPLGYERVYLPLHKVADTPFHIQRDDISMHIN